MMLDSERSVNRIETPQRRCERIVGSFIADLETRYSTQAVNDALQSIFVPSSDNAALPPLADTINERMTQLHDEFGEQVVTSALYEIDKARFPHPEVVEKPERNELEANAAQAVIGEIESILEDLRTEHPDAYELAGGQEQEYHLDEMPLYGSAEETAGWRADLEKLKAFAAVAGDTSLSAEARSAKLQELKRDLWVDPSE